MTRQQILDLRTAALARRDQYWVERCNDALDGNREARIACMEAITNRGHAPVQSESTGEPWRPLVPPRGQ